jgi:hypothetical protein
MSEIGEMWAAVKAQQREDKAVRRAESVAALKRAGYSFSEHNTGLHLIIYRPYSTFDFWPSTGKWMQRGTKVKRHGLVHLLTALKSS